MAVCSARQPQMLQTLQTSQVRYSPTNTRSSADVPSQLGQAFSGILPFLQALNQYSRHRPMDNIKMLLNRPTPSLSRRISISY